MLTDPLCIFSFLQAEELFLWVPRKLLMTVESAKNSVLGKSLSKFLSKKLICMGSFSRRTSFY